MADKTKAYLYVPVYIVFESPAGEAGTEPVAPRNKLLEWLEEAVQLDVDTEGCGNPYGFSYLAIDWELGRQITRRRFAKEHGT